MKCELCNNESTVNYNNHNYCSDCYSKVGIEDYNYKMKEYVSKDDYYLNIAKAVSLRSKCLKMKVGAIIVKNDVIVSTGYNGPARDEYHCTECVRLNKPHGSSYTKDCPAVHAEENAIINAARHGSSILNGILYLYSEAKSSPCYRCKRVLKNAGIKRVVYK